MSIIFQKNDILRLTIVKKSYIFFIEQKDPNTQTGSFMMQLQDIPFVVPTNQKMPKYRQIAAVLEEYLRCAKPAAGEKFFTDRVLAKHFSTTVVTVAHSLNYLCSKGLLVRKVGSGTFVAGRAAGNVKRRIGIICHEMISNDNFYVRPMLSRFGGFFSEMGYDVISFCALPEDYRRLVDEYELSGVVIFVPKVDFAPAIKELHEGGVPVISIGYANPALPGIAFGTDHEKTIDMAVDYLYQLGHRKIALLNTDFASTQVFLRGYQKAMWERNLPAHPDWHICLDPKSPVSRDEQLMQHLQKQQMLPTAAIIGSISYSGIVYRVIQQMGMAIPENFSLIGLGNGRHLEEMEPPLTVVAQDLEKIADNAAQALFKKIMNGNTVECDLDCAVPPLLIKRGSCAKID